MVSQFGSLGYTIMGKTAVPLHGNFELRPLGVAMGNAISVTRVWSIHIKTPPVGRRQPMTSLPARPQYKGRQENTSSTSFVFIDCFVWSVQSSKSTVFSIIMASTSKAFKKCVDPCPRYLTPDDTHNLCVFCLGKEHARDVLEGKICVYCEPFFYKKAPLSSVPLFEERGTAVCFPQFGTHRCRGTEANEIVGFAVGSGRWVREGPPLFACVGREREWAAGLWWCDLSDIIRFSG